MFELTKQHVQSIMDAAARGCWDPFIDSIDPEVHWMIGDPAHDPVMMTGIYNLRKWQEDVNKGVFGRLLDGLQMRPTSVDVFGQKAIVEAVGTATQKNGNPYNNRYANPAGIKDEAHTR
ncbi:unnamed protein product [Clonostachys chloroleuca]|uniref:Uncharacterized protein n=1 Tax=Clonostachys chloroleuca TaxID=1926264 RepID=A0AA35M3B7_9HYPO|nr:unnamed protein product [Clonostachys chloroleuca]